MGPNEIDNSFFRALPIEGAAFAALVMLAFRPVRPLVSILVILISAAANMSVAFTWPFLSGIPALVADWLELADATRFAVLLGWLATVGALIFCAILDFVGRLPSISVQTYYWAIALVPLSAVPFLMPGETSVPLTLALHKTLWWLSFSVALILTNRREPTSIATADVA